MRRNPIFKRADAWVYVLALATLAVIWLGHIEALSNASLLAMRSAASLFLVILAWGAKRHILGQKALRDTQRKFEMLVEGARDYAMILMDAESRITLWNAGAERITGFSEQEAIGRPFSILFTPEDIAAGSDKRELETARVTGRSQDDRWHQRKDGSRFFSSGYVRPVSANGGHIDGYVKVMRDITGQKRLADELEHSRSELKAKTHELERSNRDLENFALIASHDLQSPLRTIGSYLDMFEQKYSAVVPDDGRRLIKISQAAAERMRTLVNDLLHFASLGKSSKETTPVKVEEVVREVLRGLAREIEESKADVRVGPLPTVQADYNALLQVFQNLVGNAIKYRQPNRKPEVLIDGHDSVDLWTFSVNDNGIGINQEHFQRIFAPFDRLHSRNEYPGTGIGLAIVKRILERFGGEIWVESREGAGSTFRFTLPKPRRRADQIGEAVRRPATGGWVAK